MKKKTVTFDTIPVRQLIMLTKSEDKKNVIISLLPYTSLVFTVLSICINVIALVN